MENSTPQRILVVDDDRKLAGLIKDYLTPLGYEVILRYTGPEGLEEAKTQPYDALILDVMMPGMDGINVLKELRKHSNVPVLMLTALGEEADRIVGLEMGADDYLPKTFSTRELLARLRAVIRRSSSSAAEDEPAEHVVGPLKVSEESHAVSMHGKPVDLTALEFAILTTLVKAKGRVKTREALLDEVSERKFEVYDRSIDVHVSSLRKKLGDDAKNPRFIKTIRSVGYLLQDPDDES